MNFASIKFIIYLAILVLIFSLLKNNTAKKIILLISSLIFYATINIKFLFLILYVSTIAYIIYIKNMNKTQKKIGLFIGIILLIIPLFVFKYYNFFLSSFANLFNLNVHTLKVLLPIGISFYTFEAISLVVDSYNGKISHDYNYIDVLFYLSFFPSIVAGPIVKARDFLPQIKNKIIINHDNLSEGIQKFTYGLFKKIVIADRLAVGVNAVYDSYGAYSGVSLILTCIAYSLQIYYDFSGYSDMAIGIAKIFGFDLGKNFNLPYLSKNLSEFWKRWHISLSSWFKEYVYIPLGGNKKGKCRSYINIVITMVLSGLWHGAGISYIVWGFLHGIGSVMQKLFNIKLKKATYLNILFTYFIVIILWIPFRITNFNDVINILHRMLSLSKGINYISLYFVLFFIFTLVYEIVSYKKNAGNDMWKPLDLRKFKNKVLFACFIFIILIFAFFSDGAFIYANF